MSTLVSQTESTKAATSISSLQESIGGVIDGLINTLPNPKQLTSAERRGIVARYTSVLEGNFIYWMTASLIAVKSEEAKEELVENLHEEVKDAHPDMIRRFAMAAHSFPNDKDALAVHDDVTKVRKFLGRLEPVQSLVCMAFFEGFIQRFMPFLANLAAEEGSKEMEYTDVHGVCDIAHTEGLYRALATEMSVNTVEPGADLLEGVTLLRTLVDRIVYYKPEAAAA
jgi:hypothetical protein